MTRTVDPRRGVALPMALVALALIAILFGVALKRTAGERRLIRAEERALQADWLAESGLERAAARLGRDADYHGETWSIPAEALGGPDGAEVFIEVEAVDGRPDLRRVRARADYPVDAPRRARRTKSIAIAIDEGRPDGPEEGR